MIAENPCKLVTDSSGTGHMDEAFSANIHVDITKNSLVLITRRDIHLTTSAQECFQLFGGSALVNPPNKRTCSRSTIEINLCILYAINLVGFRPHSHRKSNYIASNGSG